MPLVHPGRLNWRRTAFLLTSFVASVAIASASQSESPGVDLDASKGTPPGAASRARKKTQHRVEDLLSAPVFAEGKLGTDGVPVELFARVKQMKAHFHSDGFTVYPAFGPEAKEDYRVHFHLAEITSGDQTIELEQHPCVARTGEGVALDRGAVNEIYHVRTDEIEQTFVFDDAPRDRELVIRIGVDSNLDAFEDESGICFGHEGLGGISYGDAFVIDGSGERLPIKRTWDGSAITLTVPADFLAGATFPITVDPPVRGFGISASRALDFNVDICYAADAGVYWAVWEHWLNERHSDVYAMSLDANGVNRDFVVIEGTTENWRDPSIGYHKGSNRCLVAAEYLGMPRSGIKAQLLSSRDARRIGGPFYLTTESRPHSAPDVGGNSWDSTSGAYFCVTWQMDTRFSNETDAQYRLVDWHGAMITPVRSLGSPGSEASCIQPAVSASQGDMLLEGDFWTLTWIERGHGIQNGIILDGITQGRVMARYVACNGDPAFGGSNFIVHGSYDCSSPSVTSRFDRPLASNGNRPSLVVYERSGSPLISREPTSIYGRIVTWGLAHPEVSISGLLEDFDSTLDQSDPTVACDGNCFVLAYSEIWFGGPSGRDYDTYMLSGSIADGTRGPLIALAERHQSLAATGRAETNPSIAMKRDGDSTLVSDEGMVLWVKRKDHPLPGRSQTGIIEGSTVEPPTAGGSLIRAIGSQFCDANPNSTRGQNGRQSSWSWMAGDQSVNRLMNYHCVDAPKDVVGYVIAGLTFGAVNMPGNSAGRLCVLGGRSYLNRSYNSGPNGEFHVIINPGTLPYYTFTVGAQIGDTWGFQFWHRESSTIWGGSSNYSNAVKVQFTR